MQITSPVPSWVDLVKTTSGFEQTAILILLLTFLYAVYFHRGLVALLLALPALSGAAFIITEPMASGAAPTIPLITAFEVHDIRDKEVHKLQLLATISANRRVHLKRYQLQLCYRFNTTDAAQCPKQTSPTVRGNNPLAIYPDHLARAQWLQVKLIDKASHTMVSSALLERMDF